MDKPALLRRLFELGCAYSGQILSYTKMLGQLQDAGNTTTLAHYLELLEGAGMLRGLPKYAAGAVPSARLQPEAAGAQHGADDGAVGPVARGRSSDATFWGRLVESAVGGHLANAAAAGVCEVFYWRERSHEVDFVVRAGKTVTRDRSQERADAGFVPGLAAFGAAFPRTRKLLVGGDGIAVEEFLEKPVEHWVKP